MQVLRGQLAVRNDDDIPIPIDDLGGPDIDSHHPSHQSLELDDIPHLEGALEQDDESGDDVIEDVLHSQSDTHQERGRTDHQRIQIHSSAVRCDKEGDDISTVSSQLGNGEPLSRVQLLVRFQGSGKKAGQEFDDQSGYQKHHNESEQVTYGDVQPSCGLCRDEMEVQESPPGLIQVQTINHAQCRKEEKDDAPNIVEDGRTLRIEPGFLLQSLIDEGLQELQGNMGHDQDDDQQDGIPHRDGVAKEFEEGSLKELLDHRLTITEPK